MKKLLYTTLLLLASCKLAYSANTSNTEKKITIKVTNKAFNTQSEKIPILRRKSSINLGLIECIENTDFYKKIKPSGNEIDTELYSHGGQALLEKDKKVAQDDEILIEFSDMIIFHDPEEQDQYKVKAGLSLTIDHLLQRIKDKDKFKKILKRETIDYCAILYRDEKNEYVNIPRITRLWDLKTKTDNIHLKLASKAAKEEEDKKKATPEPNDEEDGTAPINNNSSDTNTNNNKDIVINLFIETSTTDKKIGTLSLPEKSTIEDLMNTQKFNEIVNKREELANFSLTNFKLLNHDKNIKNYQQKISDLEPVLSGSKKTVEIHIIPKNKQNDHGKNPPTPEVTSKTERYVVRGGCAFILFIVCYFFYRKTSSSSEETRSKKPSAKHNKRRGKR